MKKAQKTKMNQAIEKHGQKLNENFGLNIEPVTLCKRLFGLEKTARRAALDYANGFINEVEADRTFERTKEKVFAILNIKPSSELGNAIFINSDPRGCSLKITEEYMRKNAIDLPTDWGGFGLIAPDFSDC